jgi:hypothetical protein
LKCSLNYVLSENDFLVTKFSPMQRTHIPFTQSYCIFFFSQWVLTIHINSVSVLYTIKSIISQHLPISLQRKAESFFFEFSLHLFSLKLVLFFIVNMFSCYGYRDKITQKAICWPLIGQFHRVCKKTLHELTGTLWTWGLQPLHEG